MNDTVSNEINTISEKDNSKKEKTMILGEDILRYKCKYI